MLVAVLLSFLLGSPAVWAQTTAPRSTTESVVHLELRALLNESDETQEQELHFLLQSPSKSDHLRTNGIYLLKQGSKRIGAVMLVGVDEDSKTLRFRAIRDPIPKEQLTPDSIYHAYTKVRLPASEEKITEKRGYRPDHRTAYIAWSAFTYTETLKPKYTSNQLALGATYRYELTKNRLDLWANTDLRLIPITSKLSAPLETSESIQARLLDAGVGLSLQVLPKRKPIGIGILAGAHYSTMYVTANRFGYAHFSAPLIGIPVYYVLPTGQALDFEISYAFLRTVDFEYSNTNRRIAVKLSSTSLLTTSESLGLFLHYNNVNLHLDSVELQVNELIGGLSFRW